MRSSIIPGTVGSLDHPLRRGLAAVVALVTVLAMLVVSAPAGHAADSTSTTLGEESIVRGGSTDVTLSITGETITESAATNIMLVLDESGSMNTAEFNQMKAFAIDLVEDLNTRGLFTNGGRVGLVMFASEGRTVLRLNPTMNTVITAINSVTQKGGLTCIGCGLDLATKELNTRFAPNRVTVLLTDGVNNQPASWTGGPEAHLHLRINEAEAAGIERFAIGVSNYDLDELMLIASEPKDDHVFEVGDFDGLAGIVGGIVATIDRPTATEIKITATIADGFTAVTPIVSHGSVEEIDSSTLQWTMDSLGAETATLTYTLQHDIDGPCGTLDVHDDIDYLDAEGGEVTFPLGELDVTGCPPVFADDVPADMTVEATGSSGAVATYEPPTATDGFDGSPVDVSCIPASGSTFTFGATTVICTATDDDDNEATETFTITVVDTTAPAFDPPAPADVTVNATSPDGAVVAYTPPTAQDLVDGAVEVTCDPEPGSTFPIGATTVTCTAADTAGNKAEVTFTITVVDSAPVFGAAPDDVTVNATSPDGAVVDYTPPTAQDAVDGPIDAICTPGSGSTFPIGATTVTCTATDTAGNKATVEFTVTVQDADAQIGDLLEAVTGVGAGNSLRALVLAARDSIDADDILTACDELQALIEATVAQTGRQLTADRAELIIGLVHDLRGTLGCP